MLVATLASVVIASCYDGKTRTTTNGERIHLACIDSPELRGKRAQPVLAEFTRHHLRDLVVEQEFGIRRITEERYGRIVAELLRRDMNVGQRVIHEGHGAVLRKYAYQYVWAGGAK